jgi:hypothetical protein
MKNYFSLLIILLSIPALASVKIKEEAYIMGHSPEVVKDLVLTGSVVIDHVTSEGFEIYGDKGLLDYLEKKKLPFFDMKEMNQKALLNYPSFTELTQKLKAAEAKSPKILRLMSIGKSVKGRDLWVMKISDNVETDETEPEFKYISSMHGDEITGREMTIRLIEEIAQKYGEDQEITELVNNTEIYIMPSMNPDGSELGRRGNANWVDLNRNFPDITRDRESRPEGRQVENQAVMKFQNERQFSLSANFHGGTVVANYPWDSKYELHPFDELLRELSSVYAENNPEMKNSAEFPGGITNGAEWYVVRGGMQDWSYTWHNDLQITLELSHRKWPSYSEIPNYYKNNRDSMLKFMKEVHQGVGFKLNRKNVSGEVTIKQMAPIEKDLGSYAFKNSEFYKVLPEGEYLFQINDKIKGTQRINVRVERDVIQANGNYITLQ